MNNKEHLTLELQTKILAIKCSLNLGLSGPKTEIKQQFFSNIRTI